MTRKDDSSDPSSLGNQAGLISAVVLTQLRQCGLSEVKVLLIAEILHRKVYTPGFRHMLIKGLTGHGKAVGMSVCVRV